MSILLPALQKFYNALKHLKQFSTENSFFDNIGCIDVFLSEYRSTTFAIQESMGGNDDPRYLKNLNEFLLKDEKVAKWLNNQRITVVHKHPFRLKKILRIVLYNAGQAMEYKRFEQTVEDEKPIGDYEQLIRDTFLNLPIPEISFSVQYVFVDEDDTQEVSIFDLIEPGVTAMWRFLHAMHKDLVENDVLCDKLLKEIDRMVLSYPQHWLFDCLDYCYYKSTDSFERGSLASMTLPDVPSSTNVFMEIPKKSGAPVTDFYDAFIWMHSMFYIMQNGNLMSAFFVEYGDGTYRTLTFAASLRTTMYRYINRVAKLIDEGDVINVYLVTEMVSYPSLDDERMANFFQLNYREREDLRQKTLLSFYRIDALRGVSQLIFDADKVIEELRDSLDKGSIRSKEQHDCPIVMLTPIVNSFKSKQGNSIS